jgi:Lrp/AsnC family leucine-responsive transcriptional regulator
MLTANDTEMAVAFLDATDRMILEILHENARETAAAIARKVNLSVPAVLERIKKLRREGILLGYTTRVNRAKLGGGLLAFILVRLEAGADIAAFRNRVVALPEVLECHHLAGPYDYLLKIAVEGPQALEQLLSQTLKCTCGVQETSTYLSLAPLKEG